jgi:hypothetical protein
MADPWDGIWVKFNRAEQHATDLRKRIDVALADERLRFPLWFNADRTEAEVRVVGVPEVDPTWAAVVGDCLTNLRASLDHLAYALAEKYGKHTSRDQVQFPILNEAPTDNQGNRLPVVIKGTTIKEPAVLERLERAQPYRGRWLPPTNPDVEVRPDALWQLNKLCNIDKHRLLLLVVPSLKADDIWWGSDEGDPEVKLTWIYLAPVKDGDALARFTSPGPIAEHFAPHAGLHLVIREREVKLAIDRHVPDLLAWYLAHVRTGSLMDFLDVL